MQAANLPTIGRLTIRLAILSLVGCLWLGATGAWAQVYSPPERTITTQGHGEIRVKPDSLNVAVSVESVAQTLDKARSDNNRKMQAVVSAVKALGIPGLKLETQGVQVYPVQSDVQNNRLPKVIGYRATNNLGVTVARSAPEHLADYAGRIMDAALNAGANNVGGLNFYLDDMVSAQTQALQAAMAAAKRNASTLAEAAGVTLSGVFSIEGSPQFGGWPRPVPMYSMRAGAEKADVAQIPVETGETTVTGDVTVRYKF